MKSLNARLCAAIIVTLSTTTAVADTASKGPLACDFSGEESTFITVNLSNSDIDGAVLRFPKGYEDFAPERNNKREGISMRVFNDTFASYPDDQLLTKEGKSKSLAGIHDKLSILISTHIPLSKMLEYQLEPEQIRRLPNEKKNLHGLIPMETKRPWMGRDLFVGLHPDNSISDVIRCSKEENATSPQCGHHLEINSYDLKIGYSRTQLHRWQELGQGVGRLLECFTIEQPTQREEN